MAIPIYRVLVYPVIEDLAEPHNEWIGEIAQNLMECIMYSLTMHQGPNRMFGELLCAYYVLQE